MQTIKTYNITVYLENRSYKEFQVEARNPVYAQVEAAKAVYPQKAVMTMVTIALQGGAAWEFYFYVFYQP